MSDTLEQWKTRAQYIVNFGKSSRGDLQGLEQAEQVLALIELVRKQREALQRTSQEWDRFQKLRKETEDPKEFERLTNCLQATLGLKIYHERIISLAKDLK